MRTDGRAGHFFGKKMCSDFAKTLVRSSLGLIRTPGFGTKSVRNSYISFQRPSVTRAVEILMLKPELGKTDIGVVLVRQNGGFFGVMLRGSILQLRGPTWLFFFAEQFSVNRTIHRNRGDSSWSLYLKYIYLHFFQKIRLVILTTYIL